MVAAGEWECQIGWSGRGADQALAVLAEVHIAVSSWRQLALSPGIGLRPAELDDFAPAFEHGEMEAAAVLLKR